MSSLVPGSSHDVAPNLSGHNSGGLLWPRASSSPCPGANNTQITDSKGMKYTLLCGTSIVGSDEKSPVKTDSLADCLDLCTTTQGTCAGVTYSGTTCYRKNFVGASALQSSGSFAGSENDDSAAAVVPAPSADDCKKLGSCYQSSSSSSSSSSSDSSKKQSQHGFQLYCGRDYKQDDLTKVFAASMTQCLDACAAAAPQGCVAVAYQSGSRGNGVLNCYLKNGTDTQAFVDGSSYNTSAAFMLSASTNNGVCPSASPVPGAGGGDTGKDDASSSSVAGSPTMEPTPGSASSTSQASSSSSTSTGTIAGATVGGVAGLAILCLLVFMLMRQRKRNTGSDNNKHNEGGAAPQQNYFQTPSASTQHVPPPPSSSNFSNFTEGYGASTPSSATAYHPQQQQPQQQQHGYYAPPQNQYPYHQQPPQEQQKQPETFVQSYYEVDASPRAVEVEAAMDRPTEMADQSVWSNHEPKTLVMTMR
ncbi:hypothetical protein PG984_007872 [Apiospora sp. TS-2023a]